MQTATRLKTLPESAPVRVRKLGAGDSSRWDAFVASCPDASFFHKAGWKSVIERAMGHRTHFLYAEQGDVLTGVLPLTEIKSRLFGHALISQAFCVYGGAAAENANARAALYDAADELAVGLGVDYLEIKNRSQTYSDWPVKDLYVTFRKPIDPDPDVNMNAIPRKQRAMVRKGIKAGLVSEVDEDLERFFPVYAESVRNLGTPVFSRRFFESLKDVFGDECEVLLVSKDGRPVSTVLSFYFRDEVLPYYGGGTPEARELKGFDFLYWELMRRACARGCRVFDYGRSKKGTGSYSFKKNWGFEPEPLPYQYRLVKASSVPNVNPLNPKYRLFVNLWKRLPLPLANVAGPFIARNLG